MSQATVGAFARVDIETASAVRARLADFAGVTPFDLDEAGKVGLIIEADDLDAAHRTLMRDIRATEGVLGAWPVYADFDDPDSIEQKDNQDPRSLPPDDPGPGRSADT